MRECFYCASQFEATMQRRVFCSEICQLRYNRENRFKCFYCGDLATDRDHVFPHSATSMADRRFEGQEIVMACGECNRLLGDRAALWLETRLGYLIKSLTKRYKLNRPMPEWDAEEVQELGYSLRTAVLCGLTARKRAETRVANVHNRLRQLSSLEEPSARKPSKAPARPRRSAGAPQAAPGPI